MSSQHDESTHEDVDSGRPVFTGHVDRQPGCGCGVALPIVFVGIVLFTGGIYAWPPWMKKWGFWAMLVAAPLLGIGFSLLQEGLEYLCALYRWRRSQNEDNS